MNPFFFNNLEAFAGQPAAVCETGELFSYRELAQASDRLGSALTVPRPLVFNVCANNQASLSGYLAFLRCGAVQGLLSAGIKQELLDGLLNAYQPAYIWLPSARAACVPGKTVCQEAGYCLIRTNFNGEYDLHPDLALLLTTSGSTGSPKFVRQSYINIQSNAESIAAYLRIQGGDRPITTMPMSYTYGLSIINSHLLRGGTLLLTDSTMMQTEFWRFFKENQATTFGGVPYIYEMLKKLRFQNMDLPSLRIITQAGGRLGPELAREFARICNGKNILFYVMYGQTEATARMSYVPAHLAETKAGSIGIPIPGGAFHLIDDTGDRITDNGVVGELVYEGSNVTMGYAEGYEDLGCGEETGGVLYTGDMGRRDEDGFYYVTGRKKRFLKLFGLRVNLDELESRIKNAGFQVACAGSDDNLLIYTACKEESEPLRNFVKDRTDINPYGFKVVPIASIPRNEAGKILYSELPGPAEMTPNERRAAE